MRIVFLTLACLLTAAALPALAQQNRQPEIPHDLKARSSLDYMKGLDIMTREEMEMEAQDIYAMCERNAFQKKLFKCECIAGAYLQQREKLGPMAMQYDIFDTVTNSKQTSTSCANTESVAARVYDSCQNFAHNSYNTEFDPNTEDYCVCAANKVARDFEAQPRLSSSYVEQLRANAMILCRDPKTRAQLRAKNTQGDTAQKAAAANAIPSFKTSN